MKPGAPFPVHTETEIPVLIETLLAVERRLVELTAGEVDAVADAEGRTFLLRRAQEHLRQSEAEKRASILNALPAHIALLDTHGFIVSVNDAWRDFPCGNTVQGPGYPPGMNYIEACERAAGKGGNEARRVAAGIRAVSLGIQKTFSLEYCCNSSTAKHWFVLNASPLAGLPPVGVVVMHVNITERKLAELNSARLAAIVESSDDAMIGKDLDGMVISWNRGAEKLFGYTAEEMIGSSILRLVPRDRHLDETKFLRRIGDRERVQHYETIRCRKDQQLIHVSVTLSPIANSEGEIIGVAKVARDITERKRTEEALRASEHNMASAQRVAHFGSWEMDLGNKSELLENPLRWSDEMFRIAGFDPGSIPVTRELFFSLVPVEDHQPIRQAIAAAIRGRQPYSIIHRLVRPDGEVRIIQETAQLFFDQKTNRNSRLIGTAQDITEERKAQASLLQSAVEQRQLTRQLQEERARLLEAQRVAKLGSWETDLDSLEITWSEETYRLFEVEREHFNLTHAGFLLLVHPDDREIVQSAFLESLNQNSPCSLEHRICVPNSRVKFVEERWQPIHDQAGKAVRIHGTCQDITERKLAVEALRLSEKRFKALFDQAAVGVSQSDAATGRFAQVNRRFCEILGRTREEMDQLTFAAITHPADLERSLERMRQLRHGDIREFTDEKRYLKKNGSEVWASVTVSAMWSPGETPDFFLAVVQDITERKQLEDQFRQAQKMEAVGTLAGGIAHDFNNILAAINGYTELSCMVLTDNPEVRQHLGNVLKAGARATQLVRQILTFSRQQRLERKPVQLLPVVAETLMLLRSTIPSSVEFETSLPTNAPTILADSTQIHQILMNLGTNAWHAMKDSTGILKVSLERHVVAPAHPLPDSRLRPGVYALLAVSDSGMGMDAATQSRIFEPFFTTKPPGEGTGLGLAVVHGIMASHEGAIVVSSELGLGSTFRLYFPEHTADAVTSAKTDKPAPRGNGEWILFIDDEELLAQVGEQALRSLGYQVVSTTQPAEALEMVKKDPDRFALVVTDQTMPRMTGLVLARQLRLIRPALPIILTTGFSQALASQAVNSAGLRQLLHKPFTIQTLGNAVHAALSAEPALQIEAQL